MSQPLPSSTVAPSAFYQVPPFPLLPPFCSFYNHYNQQLSLPPPPLSPTSTSTSSCSSASSSVAALSSASAAGDADSSRSTASANSGGVPATPPHQKLRSDVGGRSASLSVDRATLQLNNGTAENGSAVRIALANQPLWQKFHRAHNEMVVTRGGRKMFPKLELTVHGLVPTELYTLTLFMRKMDNVR